MCDVVLLVCIIWRTHFGEITMIIREIHSGLASMVDLVCRFNMELLIEFKLQTFGDG